MSLLLHPAKFRGDLLLPPVSSQSFTLEVCRQVKSSVCQGPYGTEIKPETLYSRCRLSWPIPKLRMSRPLAVAEFLIDLRPSQ